MKQVRKFSDRSRWYLCIRATGIRGSADTEGAEERFGEALRLHRACLRYVSPDDVYVPTLGECCIDATPYLSLYGTDACGLARTLLRDLREEAGVCAAAGAGANLFLARVALDVLAERADERIAALDEGEFRRTIWFHRPITDIWGIGPSAARRLERLGAKDLAGVASLDEKALYRAFGGAAEYLIDHAWGQEPCTLEQIRRERPAERSAIGSRVLPRDRGFKGAYEAAGATVARSSRQPSDAGDRPGLPGNGDVGRNEEWEDGGCAGYRRRVLQGISERIAREGAHRACSHEGRGRQFMPLAALRTYSDMVAEVGLDGKVSAGLLH